MTISRDTFKERAEEIELYFEFLKNIIEKKASLIFPLPRGAAAEIEREEASISLDLTHTLKANGFLLLYNLVEATATNALDEIHEELERESDGDIGSDHLIEPLMSRSVRRFKVDALSAADLCAHPASRLILRSWLNQDRKDIKDNRNPWFSGNVDALKIRQIAGEYGFSSDTDKAKTKNGGRLVNVKKTRNELAHGHTAFRDCGRNVEIETLCQIKDEVIHYLSEILDNVESYIRDRGYLAKKEVAIVTPIIAGGDSEVTEIASTA
ncbi:hypothetical protein GGD92_20000 [Pseudomonas protegens]|uniref:MAE-28990/MAE-18760-like HEPN domain-containing protein n=1 Tax=Pseudomonas protegens TaxID=380021 RepID=A0A7G7XKD3_9PSED|nr:MAE_28990/MAE_18760 family HEPN-like nuclease [Pseudomonas protegens]QNH80428.1 hypothetical protein GGI48_15075 [Pseudomonas protegens]QNL03855.1 hypothetical protein GGD92_20000 [Pseudomonas protegens]